MSLTRWTGFICSFRITTLKLSVHESAKWTSSEYFPSTNKGIEKGG